MKCNFVENGGTCSINGVDYARYYPGCSRECEHHGDKIIADYINELQKGKVGIYPYNVAVSVSTEFGITYKEAAEHVLKHIRKEMTIAQTPRPLR